MRLKRQLFRPGKRIEQIGNLSAAPFFSRRVDPKPVPPTSPVERDGARRPLLARIAENVGALFSIAVSLLLLGVIVAFLLAFMKEIHREAIFLDPLEVPDDLVKRGYTSAVVTERIIDQLQTIQRVANTSKPRQGIDNAATQVDVQVPGGAMSMKSLVRYARNMLDLPEEHITGEITHDADALSLTLRLRDRRTVRVIGRALTAPTVDGLFTQGAEAIVRATDPYVLASYYFVREDSERKFERTMQAIEYVLSQPSADDEVWAWNLWGVVLERQGRPDEALAKYRRSIAAEPAASPAYGNLASLLIRSGRRNEARQVAVDLEAEANPTAKRLGQVGDIYGQLLDDDGAVEAYRRAISLDTTYAYARSQLGGTLWQMRRYAEAEKVLREATERYPTTTARLNYAGVLMDRGQIAAAHDELVRARATAQQPGEADFVEALLMLVDRRFPESSELFERAVNEGNDENPYAWWGWGRSLAGQQQLELAIAKYRKAIDIYPVMSESYTDLGAALSLLGKTDEALSVFSAAETVASNYPRFYHEWSLALERAGRKDEAARDQAKAVALAAREGVKW